MTGFVVVTVVVLAGWWLSGLLDETETERGCGEGGDAFAQRRGVTGCGHVAEAAEVETDAGLIAGRTESSSRSPRSVSVFKGSGEAGVPAPPSHLPGAELSVARVPRPHNHQEDAA